MSSSALVEPSYGLFVKDTDQLFMMGAEGENWLPLSVLVLKQCTAMPVSYITLKYCVCNPFSQEKTISEQRFEPRNSGVFQMPFKTLSLN